jgi:hypothetical protein
VIRAVRISTIPDKTLSKRACSVVVQEGTSLALEWVAVSDLIHPSVS